MILARLILPCLLAAPIVTTADQTESAPGVPVPGASTAPAPESPEKRIDRIFKEWDSTTSPGAGVAVIQHGKVVFEKGFGIANMEYAVPIRPDTVFHVASVSKQFTAMAVVLLESDGKLSLEDDVHKYLPELPDYGQKISIRNLLQHTSGIRDQWQTLALAGWSLEDVITQDQILRMLFRQKELNFPPGTKHLYSNGGFTLLAEIVTRVSGRPFPEFCAERIFGPLGMTHTHFHQDLTQLVPGRAYSYHVDGNAFAASPLNYATVGATSLFTTAGDLVRWLDNFRNPQVGGTSAVGRLQEACVLADGTRIDYGLGLGLGTYRGLPILWHNGGDAGFRSEVLWFPKQELGIAVVSNLASFNAEEKAKEVAAVYIGGLMAPKEAKSGNPEPKYITADPKELEKYAGTYPIPSIGQTVTAVVKDGKLWAAGEIDPPLELRPVGPGHFYIKELKADIVLTPRPDGGMAAKITQPGAVNEAERIPAAEAKVESDLRQYTGVYWSEELETQYTIYLRGGVLVGMHARHGEFSLTPTFRDRFKSSLWFASEFRFVRNAAGEVSGARLGGGRVTGILFERRPGGVLELKAPAPASVSGDALAAIVGRYNYNGPILTVTREGNRVYAQLGLQQRYEIFPKSETEFYWKVVDARVTFVKDSGGRVVSATHSQNGQVFSAPRIPDVAEYRLGEEQVEALLGDYDAGPSVTMTISREGGRLYTRLTGQPRFELGATSATELYLKQYDVQVRVIKDASGRVTSVISHQLGVDHEWPKLDKPRT
jgi:CubicO group peptidase (beta-lactamase class C family)